jgi:hypothetical protein
MWAQNINLAFQESCHFWVREWSKAPQKAFFQVLKYEFIFQGLKKLVTPAVMEEETKQLVANWTHPNFAKTVRAHLKTHRLTFQ